jgi:uncharacterized membrane protein YqjE
MEGMTLMFCIITVISTIGLIWTLITNHQDNLKKQTMQKECVNSRHMN